MISTMNAIEQQARDTYGKLNGGTAAITIGDTEVRCTIISAMVNRGYHTGAVYRANWTIKGKRASATKVAEMMA